MSDETSPPRLILMNHLLGEFVDDATKRHEAKQTGKPMGAVTGFSKLDDALGSALSTGLHILHGTPGSGKTAFALQLASQCQCPAMFVTCEMAPLELLRRLTSRLSGQYLGRFKTGEMTPEAVSDYAERAIRQVPMLSMLDATRSAATREHIQVAAEKTRQLAPDNPHLLIVVDSVHSWVRGWQAEVDEYAALNKGLDILRSMAQELNCAVVGIGERNRSSMKEGGQSASAGTRSFEYSSESVIELQAVKDKHDAADGKTHIEVTLSKNRNGALRKLDLLFEGRIQSFEEI